MTNEDPKLDENEESTLNEERESEDASLEDLFNDESEESQEESDADKVKRLEEKLANIEKGVKKLATDRGREAKEEPKRPVKETNVSVNDEVVEELLLTKYPEAEHILDELKDVAKQTGKSVLKLYRESKYFRGEAKAITDAKKIEEEAKSKIKTPSNGTSSQKTNLASVKEEKIGDLSPEERLEWFEIQAKKEREAID